MRKTKRQNGFTLIEMLIVVAIIAILVAVSIPLVSNSLERTRQATDAANERAAKAEAIIMYLNDEWVGDKNNNKNIYDAATGSFTDQAPDPGYGKCSTNKHQGDYITVTIDTDGTAKVEWKSGGAAHNGNVGD